MHFLDPLFSLGTILSVTLAFAEVHNNNWRGTALGTVCALAGIVALI